MKIKGIPFWEQHIEKFILAGFGVVALGVGAMQFLLRPTDVTLENQPAGPEEVERALKARADAVSSKLAGGASGSPLVEGELPLAMKTFPGALEGGVSPRTTLPTTAPALAAAILPSEAAIDAGRFYEPNFAAPKMVTVRQESDTLADGVLKSSPELADAFKFAPGDPEDVTWLVPVAEVDVAAIRSELRRAMLNQKPPILAIPGLWYKESLWLVDVVFERQELGADGNWSSPQAIGLLPARYQFTFRNEIPKAGVDLREEMFRLLSQNEKVLAVLQPDFLPTKGETFSAGLVLASVSESEPKSAVENPEARRLSRLRQSLKRVTIERDRTEVQVKELGGPCEPPKSDDPEKKPRGGDSGGDGGGARSPGGGGLGGGMSGGGGGKNRGQPEKKEDLEKCVRMTRRLKSLNDELAKIEAEIGRLAPSTSIGSSSSMVDLGKDAKVYVWAHDLWVKPGATYRYTCRIESFNPFFARKLQLIPEQQRLSDPFVLSSKTSAPSDPVTVKPPVAIFVTEAQPNGGRLGMGTARLELYRFFDGARRSQTVDVQPGDRVGAVQERRRDSGPTVDFSTEWYVVDILSETTGAGDGVQVLLRRANGGEMMVRSPAADESSSERLRFEDEVQSPRAGAPVKEPEQEETKTDGGNPPRGPGSGLGGG
jgi:uncharacterized membrane protein YgcG